MLFSLVIDYTSITAATAPADYTTFNQQYTYPMGTVGTQTETPSIITLTDTFLEDTETFILSLTSTGLNGFQTQTTLSIQDANCELLVVLHLLR